MEKVIIIGAGPCGLSAAVECKRRGLDPLIIEKGCIVNSIYHFPTHMLFFSTPSLIEIGDIPFTTVNEKPTKQEALTYYRLVAAHYQLRIHTYETVKNVAREKDHFTMTTTDRFGEIKKYQTENVVIATGYYDQPNMLNIPGEDLAKVSHYFKDAHPYQGMKVAVIGAKNSGVDAALELERVGADVTVIYRRGQISESVKPWVRPLFESAIRKEKIKMMWNAEVTEIKEKSIVVKQHEKLTELDNDFVFALTGYRPNRKLLEQMGVKFDDETGAPKFDEQTMETHIPGLYIAGVVSAGNDANSIFIENGRFHGRVIAKHIQTKTGVN